MARPLRIEYPGAVYHVTSRGNARERIYLQDEDYTGFLNCLCVVVNRFNWILHAYCLLSDEQSLSSVDRDSRRESIERDAAVEWDIYSAIQSEAQQGWTCLTRKIQSNPC